MKLEELVKKISKESVFESYTKLVENFKDFEEIEKEEMVEEIKNIYKDYQNIIEICSYKELEYLNQLLKKKKEVNEKENTLFMKFLLFYHDGKEIIPKEFEKNIKKAIKKVNEKEKKAIDGLNDTIIGLIKMYGIIEENQMISILEKQIDVKNEVVKLVLNNRYLKFYTYQIELEEKNYYIYEPYYFLEKELIATINLYPDMEPKEPTLEEMIECRFHLFDTKKESIQNFLQELSKYKFDPSVLFYKIMEHTILDYKRDDLKEFIKEIKKIKKANQEKLFELLEKAMNDMPSAALKGNTPNECNQKFLKSEYEKNYKKTIENMKENETIEDYKSIREETEEMFSECAMYLMESHQEEIMKLQESASKNGLTYKMEDANIVNNLILFHTLTDEKNLFSKYMEEKMNVASKKYKIAWQVEESIVETLFKIKKLNPKEGTVTLEDIFTKKKYQIYDLAFSSGSKNIVESYIYTTILTVNKFTFANGYAFIFIKETHEDILKEIEKEKKALKGIKKEQTKMFFACNKIFKKEDVFFSARPLE